MPSKASAAATLDHVAACPVLPAVIGHRRGGDGIPAVLACGALSSVSYIQEPTQRMVGLLPGSRVVYIPNSKLWWQVEGADQVEAVAALLEEILKRSQECHQ